MTSFIGRKKELILLKETFDSPRSEFRIIRGRRRVGKTSLLLKAAKKRNDVIFLTGLEDIKTDRKNRDRFTVKLAKFSKDNILLSSHGLDWPALFEAVAKIAAMQSNLILIFDEIQWLARHGSGFLSDLKEAWTTKFQPSNKIKIIICGSSNKFFAHKTAGAESVLHRLRTMSDLWVTPMTLDETALFCDGWNKKEILLTQMMLGGVPYYLDLIHEPERGFIQCINEIAFTSNTIFFNEIEETLKLDISSTKRAWQVLAAIGQEGKTMKRIAEESLVPTSTVDELLEKLTSYQIIYKHHPLGEPLKGKDFGVKYSIRDEFVHFFFSVLDKEKRRIENNIKGKMLFSNILREGYYIQNFTGKAFELAIRKIIEKNGSANINKILSIHNILNYEVGTYWKRKGATGNQIDLIIDSDEDRTARIIEIKWVNHPVKADKDNAIEQVLGRCFPNHKKRKIRRFVISSSGFTEQARQFAQKHKVGLITLEDLF